MPTEIQSGVYDITTLQHEDRRLRSYFFTNNVPTLIDTGLEHTADTLFDGIAAIGVEPERLIVTHGDGDHIGGFDAIVNRYDLETWIPKQTTAETETQPDHRYEDEEKIGKFTAIHVPGHKPDNHALINEDAGILVTGDALSGSDQRGLPPGYLLLPPAVFSKNLNEAEANLEKILTYDFETALVFHGTSVVENAKDRLDTFVNFPGKP